MIRIMRLARHSLLAGAVGLAAACATPTSPVNDAASSMQAEHVAHLLGYLDADYTRFGASERTEHLAMAREAARLALGLPGAPDLPRKIEAVSALVEGLAPATEVHTRVGTLRSGLFNLAHAERSPSATPNLARGRALYEQNCAVCHGVTGHADTVAATNLRPHPANFSEPAFGASISPYDVTTAIRFGVDGTPMVPFPSLPETDRWDIAFYVAGLRHQGALAEHYPSLTPSELALVNDTELSEELFAAGITRASLPPTLNALRRRAPFETRREGPIAAARRELDTARVATVRGDRETALDAVLAAKEDGARSARATVSSADPDLATKLGGTFTRLTGLVRGGAPADEVTAVVETTLGLLTYAERVTAVPAMLPLSALPGLRWLAAMGGLLVGAPAPVAGEWPTEVARSTPATTSAKAACSDPGFGPGPELHTVDGGLPVEVTHNCMFPGNDRLEVMVQVHSPEPPKRGQVDALLRGLLDQVRNGTGDRMPELTHINAYSADGKEHYGRLELDGDEGPQGELEIFLNVAFDADEWAKTFAAGHIAGSLGASKPVVSVDHTKREITVTYPFAERVTATRAYIDVFPWLFDFYPPRTDVQAIRFIGVTKGRQVFAVHIPDLRTFLSMNPWPIRERMAAAGIPIEASAPRTPAQDAVLAQEYARALAKLPKGSVVVE